MTWYILGTQKVYPVLQIMLINMKIIVNFQNLLVFVTFSFAIYFLQGYQATIKAVTGLYLTFKVQSLEILSFSTVFEQSCVSFLFPI